MTFPVVQGTNTSSVAASASHSVALPSGITSGDLLLIILTLGAGAALTLTTPSGWTQLYNVVGSGNQRRVASYWKTASGSEGSTVSVSASGSGDWAANSYRISSWQGIETTTTASGTTSSANPPSLSPSWGAKDTLWIAACHTQTEASAPTAPTSYANLISDASVGTTARRTSSASRTLNTATEDPSSFTLSSLIPWIAATIAIQPAPPVTILAADPGSFTLTGQDAGFLRSLKAAADAGAFTLTGQNAGLLRGLKVPADAGSYALTGQAATLTYTPLGNPVLAVDAGSFALTGQAAGLLYSRSLLASAGAFALTGQAAGLTVARAIAANSGSYALTGQDAALRATRILAANAGSYTLAGQIALLLRNYPPLSAGAGAFALTGVDATLLKGIGMLADGGSYALTGRDVLIGRVYILTADGGLYELEGVSMDALVDLPEIAARISGGTGLASGIGGGLAGVARNGGGVVIVSGQGGRVTTARVGGGTSLKVH